MLLVLKLAWRNVHRNTRRSILTVLIFAVGLATLVISNALYDGFHEKMVVNAVRIFIGHLQVHAEGFHANPTVDKCFVPPPETSLDLLQVAARARRVRFQSLASTAATSQGVMVVGIEPEREAQVTNLKKSLVSGTYLGSGAEDRQSCLVGERLMESLRLEPGEKLVLFGQAYDGSIAAAACRVSGVCRTGNPEIDRSFVWMPIVAAQEMLGYGDRISELVFLTRRSNEVPAAERELERRLAGAGLEVLSWKEVAPDIVQLVELDIAMQTVLMIIISIIVALAIMNTMLMAIQERFTEFGVMAAIGTRPGQIIAVLMTESFFLGLLGLAAGALVTMLGLIYLFWHGVNLSAFSAGVMKLIGMDTTVRPLVQLKQVVVSSLVVLLSGTLVSILPALRAAHLEPVEAIRHI